MAHKTQIMCYHKQEFAHSCSRPLVLPKVSDKSLMPSLQKIARMYLSTQLNFHIQELTDFLKLPCRALRFIPLGPGKGEIHCSTPEIPFIYKMEEVFLIVE